MPLGPAPTPTPNLYPTPNQVNGCLSGLSTVFNEWLIKFQDPKVRGVGVRVRARVGVRVRGRIRIRGRVRMLGLVPGPEGAAGYGAELGFTYTQGAADVQEPSHLHTHLLTTYYYLLTCLLGAADVQEPSHLQLRMPHHLRKLAALRGPNPPPQPQP